MISSVYRLPEKTTEEELLQTIDFLNKDPEVDGFIVQLPLPDHINVDKVIDSIDPSKDVDGFTLVKWHLGNQPICRQHQPELWS